MFARHIAKHLEGNPTIIVQNMGGAAGLRALSLTAFWLDSLTAASTISPIIDLPKVFFRCETGALPSFRQMFSKSGSSPTPSDILGEL